MIFDFDSFFQYYQSSSKSRSVAFINFESISDLAYHISINNLTLPYYIKSNDTWTSMFYLIL